MLNQVVQCLIGCFSSPGLSSLPGDIMPVVFHQRHEPGRYIQDAVGSPADVHGAFSDAPGGLRDVRRPAAQCSTASG